MMSARLWLILLLIGTRGLYGTQDLQQLFEGKKLMDQGVIEFNAKNFKAAYDYFKKADALFPDNCTILTNLAHTCFRLDDLDNALALFKKLTSLQPCDAAFYRNIALIASKKSDVHEAIAAFIKAIELDPQEKDNYFGLSQAYQKIGDFAAAWQHVRVYDSLALSPFNYEKSQWQGEPLEYKTILLVDNVETDGLGDVVHWIRYAPLLKAQGARVIVHVRSSLIPLLATCKDIDELIALEKPVPQFDWYILLNRLMYVCHTTLQTIPAPIPYLHVSQNLVKCWSSQFSRDHFNIGICWQAQSYINATTGDTVGNIRSVPLELLANIAFDSSIHLYSLQKFKGAEQLQKLPKQIHITTFGADFDKSRGRFIDTAAVMMNLDLVITVDTSVAHLAGALGVPVWVMLPVNADWRWFMDRTDSPWYPTMRLFRQSKIGDWAPVIKEITQVLKEHRALIHCQAR